MHIILICILQRVDFLKVTLKKSKRMYDTDGLATHVDVGEMEPILRENKRFTNLKNF